MESPLQVLIVEDEVILAMQFRSFVEEAGYEVIATTDTSAEALRVARDCHPDIAFVDIHLSDGLTGVALARAVAAECNVVVFFVTANDRLVPQDFAGAAGIVAKPYTSFGVLSALEFIQGCLLRNADAREPPASLVLAPAYRERWCGLSGAGGG